MHYHLKSVWLLERFLHCLCVGLVREFNLQPQSFDELQVDPSVQYDFAVSCFF